MAAPTAAELNARADELDRREASITTREEQAARRDTDLTDRLETVEQREGELTAREAEVATAIENLKREPAPDALTYSTLPEPQDGHGFVVVEAPLPLVAVFANLHPSERGTIGAQMAAAMRQTLQETGKLNRGRHLDPAPVETGMLAVIAANEPPARQGTVTEPGQAEALT